MPRTEQVLEDWYSETTVPATDAAAHSGSVTIGAIGILVVDQAGLVVDCCRHIESMFGCARQRLVGRPLTDLLPEIGSVQQMLRSLAQARRLVRGAPEVLELSACRPDGSRFPVSLAHCTGSLTAPASLQFVLCDATPLRDRLEHIQRLATTVEQTGDAVAITDSSGRLEYVNRAFEEITGYRRREVLGNTMAFLKSGLQTADFYRNLWATIRAGRVFRARLANRRKSGEIYYEEKTISPVRDAAGRITHFVSTAKDVTDRVRAEERLHQLANFDTLTGLPNRHLFMDRLAQTIALRARDGRPMALLYLDLDRFKLINDTLGHAAGDELLRLGAERLRASVREVDTVARLGGDEFTVILSQLGATGDARRVIEKLLTAFSAPFPVFERSLYVSLSIGAALYPQDGQDASTLLKHADVAMYDAKSAGRNRYAFYQAEMNASAADTLGLEMDLREALARRALFLEYQPQVDLVTGRLAGVEALLRWEHPWRGRVPPDRFIGLLEDMGLIGSVTTEVLVNACGDIARLNARFELQLQVAVNLSNAQFRDPTLVEQVHGALAGCGLAPALLELEMTERTLMQDVPATQSALQALRTLGVRLAVDDFGTGYSSLAYLRRFSADTIKIDRSFVRDACDDAGARSIVKAIVSLGRDLSMQVVAEGVETPEQLALLRGLACERAQGYLFSPPLPVAALEELVVRSWAVTGRHEAMNAA